MFILALCFSVFESTAVGSDGDLNHEDMKTLRFMKGYYEQWFSIYPSALEVDSFALFEMK
jgi:hypothetical protein